jgi:hypothetical protein
MPTVLRVKNLIYIIHTRDHGHPHVTVYLGTPESFEAMAKIRLDSVEAIESTGFDQRTLRRILATVGYYQLQFLEVWNETREK